MGEQKPTSGHFQKIGANVGVLCTGSSTQDIVGALHVTGSPLVQRQGVKQIGHGPAYGAPQPGQQLR
jgi:hypothetical protein